MFKCADCGAEFEQAHERHDPRPMDGLFHDNETFYVCPSCGSEEIEQSQQCVNCKRQTAISSIVAGFCPRCKKDTVKWFQQMMRNEFTPDERRLLNEVYDGEDF